MPTRPNGSCTRPGCYQPSPQGGGPCPAHQVEAVTSSETHRPSALDRGYDAKWARNSARFLAAHPDCVDCGGPATVADHAPKTRAQLIAEGEEHPDAWRHLQPRCGPCHSSKTARVDGGFGNRKLSGL